MSRWKIIGHQYWRDDERRQMEAAVQPMKQQLFSEWLRQSIQYFREMDFFKPWSELSNESLMQMVMDNDSCNILQAFQHFQSSNMLCPPDSCIIKIDKTRVWHRPLDDEMEYMDFAQEYPGILNEWSLISRGAFMPQDIVVSQNNESDIEIALTLNSTRHQFQMQDHYGHINLAGLQRGVNKLISHTGYSFEQELVLLVLTQEEKERLIVERNWWWYETPEGYF